MTDSPNVELVRSIHADRERGDFSRIDWADPQIEMVAAGGAEPGTFLGREAVGRGWRGFLSAWEHYRVAGEDFREVDDRRVLVCNLLVPYWDCNRAFADLGLAPEGF